jgi:hypothetical protein
LKKGIDDTSEVEAKEYLLLVKYALLQEQEPSQNKGTLRINNVIDYTKPLF